MFSTTSTEANGKEKPMIANDVNGLSAKHAASLTITLACFSLLAFLTRNQSWSVNDGILSKTMTAIQIPSKGEGDVASASIQGLKN